MSGEASPRSRQQPRTTTRRPSPVAPLLLGPPSHLSSLAFCYRGFLGEVQTGMIPFITGCTTYTTAMRRTYLLFFCRDANLSRFPLPTDPVLPMCDLNLYAGGGAVFSVHLNREAPAGMTTRFSFFCCPRGHLRRCNYNTGRAGHTRCRADQVRRAITSNSSTVPQTRRALPLSPSFPRLPTTVLRYGNGEDTRGGKGREEALVSLSSGGRAGSPWEDVYVWIWDGIGASSPANYTLGLFLSYSRDQTKSELAYRLYYLMTCDLTVRHMMSPPSGLVLGERCVRKYSPRGAAEPLPRARPDAIDSDLTMAPKSWLQASPPPSPYQSNYPALVRSRSVRSTTRSLPTRISHTAARPAYTKLNRGGKDRRRRKTENGKQAPAGARPTARPAP